MKPAIFSSIYLFIAIVFLSGCVGGGPPPQDHYYRLATDIASIQSDVALPYDVIGMQPGITDGLYRERPILFVNSDTPLELHQYHYHHWHDAPANIIQEHFIAWLQQHVSKSRLVRLNRGEQRDVMLKTRVVHFERTLINQNVEVLVELEIALQKKYQVLHQQHYRQTIRVEGDTMHDTVQAFGVALTGIYKDFLHDISH